MDLWQRPTYKSDHSKTLQARMCLLDLLVPKPDKFRGGVQAGESATYVSRPVSAAT